MGFLKIGQIVNTHGVKGEVKIYPYTDNIENMRKLKKIYLDSELKLEYLVKGTKIVKNMIVFKLEGIDTIEQTENIMQEFVYINKEKIKERNTYYVEDLIGLEVFTMDNLDEISKATYFGKLVDVYNTGANDIYEVKTETEVVYLPAIKDVILKVDIEEGKIYIKLMEGLI